VVHPAPGHYDDTLVNALLSHCPESLSGIGGVKRPGIVHRLDKETSGLMVVAKNDKTHNGLAAQFADHSLSRTYHALVWGIPSQASGSIEGNIGRCPRNRQKMAVTPHGKEALTHYRLLKTFGNSPNLRHHISLVECVLETGRTHQIRVHMAHKGIPVVGDPVYGHTPKGAQKYWDEAVIRFARQALHAKALEFTHPTTDQLMKLEVDYPEDIQALLRLLERSVPR
jgi:23S rRNA pseudouridine1911/1915/1917 synthase